MFGAGDGSNNNFESHDVSLDGVGSDLSMFGAGDSNNVEANNTSRG